MAKGDTKTNQYLDIAANGTRADFPASCCETRSQTLIREVGERIMDLEDEVERLENNPDVVDIVATYADLQSYDTSQLTDKDVIRVLQDETHDGDSTYYRWSTSTNTWTYIGESKQYTNFVGTDGTEAGEAGLVPAPATTDAGKFLSASGLWEAVQGGGGVTELTSADYNWPTSNPNGVALWLLDTGIYKTSSQLDFYASGSVSSPIQATLLVVAPSGQSARVVMYAEASSLSAVTSTLWQTLYSSQSSYSAWGKILTENNIATTTGNSSSAVMSQNAVTSMVFADPSERANIRIGNTGSMTGGTDYTIAIGKLAVADAATAASLGYYAKARGIGAIALGREAQTTIGNRGSIALGSYSNATQVGEMNIGSSATTHGYNNSNYRLLSGLYDPQSAHDAATKGYVDPTTDSSAPTTATVGRLGQIFIDTTNADAYMCVAVDSVTPSYTWKKITA